MAQVHRFHGFIGVHVASADGTTYLTPDEALRLACALMQAAKEIRQIPAFTSSHFQTVAFDSSGATMARVWRDTP